MSYNWQNGQIITAEKLNNNCKIQFVNISEDTENQTFYLDKNWQQIKNIYDAGGIVYVKFIEEDANFFGIMIGHIPEIFYNYNDRIYEIQVQMPEQRYEFTANSPTEQLTISMNNDSSGNNPATY